MDFQEIDNEANRYWGYVQKHLPTLKMPGWEGNRRYHNRKHIVEVCQSIQELLCPDERVEERKELIPNADLFLAAFYHDYYLTHSEEQSPEEKSASRLYEDVRKNVSLDTMAKKCEFINNAQAYIHATANHFLYPGTDRKTKIFLDSDLRILSIGHGRYTEYCRGLLTDFGVDNIEKLTKFKNKRKVWLDFVGGYPRFYHIYGYSHEIQARENMKYELRHFNYIYNLNKIKD